jgi:TonB family protein
VVVPPPDSVALSELQFIEYTEPKFPRSGNRRYDGWVDVEFQVRADGLPRYIEVVDTNLPGKFEASSIEAVQQWRFEPYVHEGTPISVNSAVRLRFAN